MATTVPTPWRVSEISPFMGGKFAPYWIVKRDISQRQEEVLRVAPGSSTKRFATQIEARAAAGSLNNKQEAA